MKTDDILNYLVTIVNRPGIYGFINEEKKQVWLTHTKNIAESILRNYNRIIKEDSHKAIRQQDFWKWSIQLIGVNKPKEDLIQIQENYLKLGYILVSKPLRCSIKGKIGISFKNKDSFLYYAWLMQGKRFIKVVGVFDSVRDGDRYIGAMKFSGGHLNANYDLLNVEQGKLLDDYREWEKNRDKEELNRLLSRKMGV